MSVAGRLPITGGCLCGAVRYRIYAGPLGARACWCRLCQYLGAGSGTVNAFFPAEAFTLTGALAEHQGQADSGSHMTCGFCPACGTHVTSRAAERPHLVTVRVGTFDDPGLIGPADTIWTEAAPDWAAIHPDLPHHPRQAPFPKR